MTIYDQIIELMEGREDEIVEISWVVEQLQIRYGTNPSSVILSDYCYNRINNGINFDKHIFEYLGRGHYKYLGENYPYTGFIYHQPLRSQVEYIVGEWRHGVNMFYEEPIIRE